MEKIASFQIDHLRMKRGVFVSRRDRFGETVITTFDIRLKEPNREPVVDVATLHSIEHLGATFFRSHPAWGPRTVYFGPMGCRTGVYLLLESELDSSDIVEPLIEFCDWVLAFDGAVPGASAAECGNWRDQNLDMAKWELRRFAELLRDVKPENLEYPH